MNRNIDEKVVQFVQRDDETIGQLKARVEKFIDAAVKDHDYVTGDVYDGIYNPEKPNGRLLGAEQDGPQVYRVPMQLDYAAKLDGPSAGREHLAKLERENGYTVGDKTYNRYEKIGVPLGQSDPDFSSPGGAALSVRMDALRARLKKQVHFGEKPQAEQDAILRTLAEASLIGRAATSGLSPNLLRAKHVLGYDDEHFTRGAASYFTRAARDMAKAEIMPKVEAQLEKLNIAVNRSGRVDRTEMTDYYNEFRRRLLRTGNEADNTPTHPYVRRLLQMTALDKLFGVSFHAVNAAEAPIMGGIRLGGKHGLMKTYATMGQIYKHLGAGSLVGRGGLETFKAANPFSRTTNYTGMIKHNLRENLRKTRDTIPEHADDYKYLPEVMDHFEKTGLLSPEAEYFFKQEATPREGKVGAILSTVDRMSRQMTQAVEGINRSVIGLSAYKMEKARLLKDKPTPTEGEKAAAHKQAMDYAHDTVVELMGNYSRTNSGHLFNDSRLGAALQFKKYAAKTYTLLGRMTKEAVQGDPAAKKSLLLLLGIQGVAAGALGLPIEPLKIAYSQATGDDADVAFEEAFRSMVHALPEWMQSDALTNGLAHGVTRAIPGVGFDTGSRLGMDNLTGVKLPHSWTNGDDIAKAAGQLFTGASLSTLTEIAKGLGGLLDNANAARKGYAEFDWPQAARSAAQMIPLKAASDIGQAVAGTYAAGETKRGYDKTKSTYSGLERLVKAAGFTPAREKTEGEARNAEYVLSRDTQRDRAALQLMWLKAGDADHRAKVWGKVEEFNRTADPDAKLTRAQLNEYLKIHERKAKDSFLGQEVHKRERGLNQHIKEIYGVQ
jgi:hypothetical protein